MALNTFVAGNPASVKTLADALNKIHHGVDDNASGWLRVRSRAESEWEGQASDAFRDTASRNGKDGDALAELFAELKRAVTVFSDELVTVKERMKQAKQVARDGELAVVGDVIRPPDKVTVRPPAPIPDRASSGEAQAYADAKAEYSAATELHAKQSAAYAEAQATVADARRTEKMAHESLSAALDTNGKGLTKIGQAGAWAQSAKEATSPAATSLMSVVAAFENHAATATRSMLENAISTGPHATSAAWASMTDAQQKDLIDRFPRSVGNADGLPAAVRSTANLRTLSEQRHNLAVKLKQAEAKAVESATQRNGPNHIYVQQAEQLRQALDGLDAVAEQANKKDMFLLSLDSDANGRGQVAIAHGNPDTAQNVMTTIPGTYSDLGNAMDYVQSGDTVMERAKEMGAPDDSFSSVTWVDYESPKSLLLAGNEGYAEKSTADLSNFQEGLRASHSNEMPPSNNTVVGHSYGSTMAGYAARDHGLSADNLVFMGSPGVGVEHASELNMPAENVWSGTSGLDIIDYATPSIDPTDYPSDERHPITGMPENKDVHFFGHNPSAEKFGARELPTEWFSGHGGYWSNQESIDGMAKIFANRTGG